MSIIISLFIIGVSLSMDTFSISLSIGAFNISKNKIIIFSMIVGIMHFIMPFIGSLLWNKIVQFLNINVNMLLGIILVLIGVEMVLELIKNEDKKIELNMFNMLLIAFSVSLDSFSTGLGLKAITDDVILSGLIFSACAASFTFLGLLLGKYSSEKLGVYGNIFGIVLLFILGIWHLFL